MSKRDWALLGYLGYKAVKKEPSRVGNELGECLVGLLVTFGFCLVVYFVLTLFFEGPSLIMNNIEIISILIGIIVVIIIGYVIYDKIVNHLERHEKLKKQYSKEINCPKCGKTIKAAAVKCKHCGYYLKRWSEYNDKQKYPYVQKSTNVVFDNKIKEFQPSTKSIYSSEMKCPVCGNTIKQQAVRCKYCKTKLKEY